MTAGVYFYYQIKGLDYNEDAYEKWSWPPLFSGRVIALSPKEARKKVEDLFQRRLPGRVKADDNSNPFLLHIRKMDERREALFEPRICEQCGKTFRRIDLYNDAHEQYKGPKFCSKHCADKAKAVDMVPGEDDPYGVKATPCIYRITHKPSGKCYIGQTTQAFTLRWWQHVKWGASDCKFHKALRESSITEWAFEVVETCESSDELNAREAFWIRFFNSAHNGYNTAPAPNSTEVA